MQVQVLWVILSVICLERTKVYCFLMKCPSYQLHFQKIVGYRPKLLPLSNHDLLRFVNPDPSLPVSMMCWNSCQADQECIGYVLFVTSNTCYGYTLLRKSTRYTVLEPEEDLVVDSDAIYFQKSCLNVPENCETQLWAITRIPGSSLVFQGKKTISTLVTRRECAEKCIFEKDFQCLSAAYRPSYKNNHARLQSAFKPAEVVGQCILTDKDKTTHPDAYRVAPTDEEYMENNCYQRPPENDTCSYELYSNSSFIYSDLRHDGLTQKECQHNCSHQSGFHCQGVTYEEEAPGLSSKCFLHSEDLISMGPRSLAVKANSVYMRRVKCLDVSVVCSQEEMIITYNPSDWFRGKIYVSSHSDECSVGGNGTNPTILRLPIGSEIKESRCGLLRAYEVKGTLKRTFISTLVVIQNNLNVQTQGDRLIKVGCILNNSSNQIPDDVALGSSLAFTQSEFPNAGSLLYNISDKMPKIFMHVLDLNGHLETNDVQIGQNLELQIIAEPNDSLYDLRAVSLTAKSLGDDSSVTLIDSRGCPTDAAIFPALEKVYHNGKKMLRARFLAFKFAGTPVVNFDVKIQFCLTECPAANCDNNILSHGRRRRKRDNAMSDVRNDNDTQITNTLVQVRYPFKYTSFLGSSDVIPLVASASSQVRNDSATSKSNLEYPLHFKLYVRGPNTGEPTTMIYGENGPIIVSGFGIVRKEVVCLDHSLLIAIIIFWIIFQILLMVSCCYLVRKYKRLGNLEEDRSSINADSSRRVHWADQGSGFYFA